MTRRILAAIVAVTAMALAVFGAALGLVVQRLYRQEAVLRLEREATRAVAEVPASFLSSDDPVELPAPEPHSVLGLYSPAGLRLLGDGPERADAPVSSASGGGASDARVGGSIVVAVAATSEEQVFAVVRAAAPESVVTARVRRAWLAMAASGALIAALAALAARVVARRLARPVATLAADVARLGGGDFASPAARSGIAELDAAAAALDATAARLGRLLGRERAFSAEASHQLRTPLTGVRLRVENAMAMVGPARDEALVDALGQLDRLEATIGDLLALARDLDPERAPLDVASVMAGAEAAWHGALAAAGRPLRVRIAEELPPARASAAALRQVLDVLVANAAEHGEGTVTLEARRAGGGVALEVSDEGPGIDEGDLDAVFRRRSSGDAGRGLGLVLARSLVEAEGGRLLLQGPGPHPTFTVVLPSRSPGSSGEGSAGAREA